ncbi:MAG: phosphate acyltransferase PlsX [Acidimicrobiaceae bacterium]|nr:phosphate acyltransferase PlsX [Acidimicrobiaceae bacterium]
MTLPIALDAMGGDHAPGDIIEGARRAVDEYGLDVTLVGVPERMGDPRGLEVVSCSEVIEMADEPGASVRQKKDSSLVRAAELVRDGRASAMVSAGNTGATMASALLRIGRLPGVVRPCIATLMPNPGRHPAVLLDSGANSECTPEMLVQFAHLGTAFVRTRFGVVDPSVGLLSIGEESSKGTPLVKETHELLRAAPGLNFFGNVEGRDLVPSPVDLVVTDGFTGNVALKTLEGAFRFVLQNLLEALDEDEVTREAGRILMPYLVPRAERLRPESIGGSVLLGLKGICIISHGSSNATAIMNALRVADEMARAGVVEATRFAIRPDQEG